LTLQINTTEEVEMKKLMLALVLMVGVGHKGQRVPAILGDLRRGGARDL
jgi:hypothetical protein